MLLLACWWAEARFGEPAADADGPFAGLKAAAPTPLSETPPHLLTSISVFLTGLSAVPLSPSVNVSRWASIQFVLFAKTLWP